MRRSLALLTASALLLLAACSDEDSATPEAGGNAGAATPIPTATPYDLRPAATIVAAASPPPGEATPTPEAGSSGPQPTIYVVEAGDVLGRIAEQFGVAAGAIMEANGITDPGSLQVGQELTIPGVDAPPPAAPTATPEPTETPAPTSVPLIHIVQSGDTPIDIANAYGVTVEALAAANGLSEADFTSLQIGQQLSIPR